VQKELDHGIKADRLSFFSSHTFTPPVGVVVN
jgi:hypothetical protein